MIDKIIRVRTTAGQSSGGILSDAGTRRMLMIFRAFLSLGFRKDGPDVRGNQVFQYFSGVNVYPVESRYRCRGPNENYYFGQAAQLGPFVIYMYSTAFGVRDSNGRVTQNYSKGLYLCHRKGKAIQTLYGSGAYNFRDFFKTIATFTNPITGSITNISEFKARIIKVGDVYIFGTVDPELEDAPDKMLYIIFGKGVGIDDFWSRFEKPDDDKETEETENTEELEDDKDDSTWFVFNNLYDLNVAGQLTSMTMDALIQRLADWDTYTTCDIWYTRTGTLHGVDNPKRVIAYPLMLSIQPNAYDGRSTKENEKWLKHFPPMALYEKIYKCNILDESDYKRVSIGDGDFITIPINYINKYDATGYYAINHEVKDGMCVLIDDEDEDDISEVEEYADDDLEDIEKATLTGAVDPFDPEANTSKVSRPPNTDWNTVTITFKLRYDGKPVTSRQVSVSKTTIQERLENSQSTSSSYNDVGTLADGTAYRYDIAYETNGTDYYDSLSDLSLEFSQATLTIEDEVYDILLSSSWSVVYS